MTAPTVRPIRADEWELVRDLRKRAVRDPAAAVAFVDSVARTDSLPDAFWQERAGGGSVDAGDDARSRQFVAIDDRGRWIGSATGLLERAGDTDFDGRTVPEDGCLVVGVYLDPAHRGAGLLGRLFDAVQEWAVEHGATSLRLSVHRSNPRARRAYEKLGFEPTGASFTGAIGPEWELRRPH
ncbi:MAG: GNAT family N-acetyltransferase [Williamsia herbipolensis]|nr:GNAT family N-acetyltransferase [Williamsia herbipolensis]